MSELRSIHKALVDATKRFAPAIVRPFVALNGDGSLMIAINVVGLVKIADGTPHDSPVSWAAVFEDEDDHEWESSTADQIAAVADGLLRELVRLGLKVPEPDRNKLRREALEAGRSRPGRRRSP